MIAQIDEPAGLAAADRIAAIDGLDAMFLGRIGLALAMQASTAEVDKALDDVCGHCRAHDLPMGLSITEADSALAWRARGVTLFCIDSDQMILSNGARTRTAEFRMKMELQSGREA